MRLISLPKGRGELRDQPQHTRTRTPTPATPPAQAQRYAAFALLAYMSTYSCPDSRMTSAITESVTARRT